MTPTTSTARLTKEWFSKKLNERYMILHRVFNAEKRLRTALAELGRYLKRHPTKPHDLIIRNMARCQDEL